MKNKRPHYYNETSKGCGICGYGIGALVHNTFEVERYNLKRLDEAKEVGRCYECGEYYPIDKEWTNLSVCSVECYNAYSNYLNSLV